MCHNCSVGGLTSAQSKMDPKRLLELERRMAAPREQPIVNNALDDASLDAVQKEWQASKSYSAALKLSRLSINGERNCSIHHMGPLDPESKGLVAGLLELHDYGMLTHNSQPFERLRPEIMQQGGGFWAQVRQRPYLSFLIPQRDRIPKQSVDRFCDLLMAHPRIVTRITETGKPMRTNLEQSHAVTVERVALSIKELYAEPWTGVTHLHPWDIIGPEHQDWDVEAITRAEPLDVAIAARSWAEDMDLIALVKDVAKEAGIGPVYAEQARRRRSSRKTQRSA